MFRYHVEAQFVVLAPCLKQHPEHERQFISTYVTRYTILPLDQSSPMVHYTRTQTDVRQWREERATVLEHLVRRNKHWTPPHPTANLRPTNCIELVHRCSPRKCKRVNEWVTAGTQPSTFPCRSKCAINLSRT